MRGTYFQRRSFFAFFIDNGLRMGWWCYVNTSSFISVVGWGGVGVLSFEACGVKSNSAFLLSLSCFRISVSIFSVSIVTDASSASTAFCVLKEICVAQYALCTVWQSLQSPGHCPCCVAELSFCSIFFYLKKLIICDLMKGLSASFATATSSLSPLTMAPCYATMLMKLMMAVLPFSASAGLSA